MSVIGPRPEDKVNADKLCMGKYKEYQCEACLSSPVSLDDYAVGERYENEEDYERIRSQKLNIELYYINHKSLIYDLKIIIRTVITIYSVLSKKEVKIPWEVKACMKSNP